MGGGGSVGRQNTVHGLTSSGLLLPGIGGGDATRYQSTSTSLSGPGASSAAGGRMCRVYATIREMTSKRSTTVCGGSGSGKTGRQKTVHVSVDHQLEIRIINSHAAPKPLVFLLRFEGEITVKFFTLHYTFSTWRNKKTATTTGKGASHDKSTE